MATEPVVTPAELPELASHVNYEHAMLHAAITALARMPSLRTREQNALRNAWIESFLLHARSLMDFMGHSIPCTGDDVVAQHYIADWTIGDAEPELTRVTGQLRAHVNKRLAHVTAYRVRVDPGSPDLGAALADIDAVWNRFLGRLSSEQRAWFRPARSPS